MAEGKQTVPYFGERALLYQEPRAATVKVVSESARCLMLDKDAFEEHLGLLREVFESSLKTMDWKADKKKKAHHPGAAYTDFYGILFLWKWDGRG